MNDPMNEFLKYNALWIALLISALIAFLIVFLLIRNNKKEKIEIKANEYVEALGGIDNIISKQLKGSRIILELKNYDIVDDNKLSGLNGAKLIKMSNKLTIVSEEHASNIYKLIFEE